MNTFTIFVILAVTAVSAENFCTPGSFFKNDCNYCTCSQDGKAAACTDMACPESLTARQAGQFCQPGKTFQMDDCNTCTCSRDGKTAQCTLQFCRSPKNAVALRKNRFCTPGTVFSPDNCNTCLCSKDGTRASCTLSACLKTLDKTNSPKQVCQPRSIFKDYCNTCTCSTDGSSFACTRMACDKDVWNQDGSLRFARSVAKSGVERICAPKTQFKEQCNTCICSNDGLSKKCTMMTCLNLENEDHVVDLESVPKQVCQPHSTFRDYCNTCTCSADGSTFACTRMACDKDVWNQDGSLRFVRSVAKSGVERVCTPKTQFKEQCNTCICSDDGLSKKCTMMTCLNLENEDEYRVVDLESVPKQVCQPRSIFKNYCNTCTCSDDGSSYACTRMACDKDVWNQDGSLRFVRSVAKSGVERVCTPKTHFKEQCNTCICSNNGLSKMCTMMTCNENLNVEDDSHKQQVCTPGKVFSPDGCNTCICNKDGMDMACTLKVCLSTLKRAAEKVEEKKSWGSAYKQGDFCEPGKLFFSECNRCICTKTGSSAICTLMKC